MRLTASTGEDSLLVPSGLVEVFQLDAHDDEANQPQHTHGHATQTLQHHVVADHAHTHIGQQAGRGAQR